MLVLRSLPPSGTSLISGRFIIIYLYPAWLSSDSSRLRAHTISPVLTLNYRQKKDGSPLGKPSLYRVYCLFNYNFGPAATKALPCSFPSNLAKFLMKR